MRFNKTTLRNSFFGWLVPAAKPVDPRVRLEEIRAVMLGYLADLRLHDEWSVMLERKLRKATEIDTLWYARSELLQLMSQRMGERPAGREMAKVTKMFQGLVNAYSQSKKPRSRF